MSARQSAPPAQGAPISSESGRKWMVTTVEDDAADMRKQGLRRTFMVDDSLGGQYDSASASASGQSLLERMWVESA